MLVVWTEVCVLSYFKVISLFIFNGYWWALWSFSGNSFNLHTLCELLIMSCAASFAGSFFFSFLLVLTPSSSSEISPTCLQIAISSGLQDNIGFDFFQHLPLTLGDFAFGKRQTLPHSWLWFPIIVFIKLDSRFMFLIVWTHFSLTFIKELAPQKGHLGKSMWGHSLYFQKAVGFDKQLISALESLHIPNYDSYLTYLLCSTIIIVVFSHKETELQKGWIVPGLKATGQSLDSNVINLTSELRELHVLAHTCFLPLVTDWSVISAMSCFI